LAEQFEARLGRSYGAMQLDYSVEQSPLGTGGGLRQAAELVQTTHLLALNGDSFCECDLARMGAAHPAAEDALTMVVCAPTAASRFGAVLYDERHRVTGFVEKDAAPAPRAGINAGLYLARTDFFRRLELGRKISLERDLFPAWAKAGALRAFPVTGRFIDIGLPASYAEAQLFFRRECALPEVPVEELRGSSPAAAAMLAPRAIAEVNRWKLAAAAVVRDAQGRILLERRRDCGLWGLLGGRMDFGESAAETVRREVREETGLDIALERLVGVYTEPAGSILSYPNGDVVQVVVIVVEASVQGGEIMASHESLDLRYFAPEELPRLLIPRTREVIEDCLKAAPAALR
jgi:8-oxo-dGTP pyrophosphatase MutT (NUDIX family)